MSSLAQGFLDYYPKSIKLKKLFSFENVKVHAYSNKNFKMLVCEFFIVYSIVFFKTFHLLFSFLKIIYY